VGCGRLVTMSHNLRDGPRQNSVRFLYQCKRIIYIWDKIDRSHRKRFGRFYPLETCFFCRVFSSIELSNLFCKNIIKKSLGDITLFLFFWLFWLCHIHAPFLANSDSKRKNMFLIKYKLLFLIKQNNIFLVLNDYFF